MKSFLFSTLLLFPLHSLQSAARLAVVNINSQGVEIEETFENNEAEQIKRALQQECQMYIKMAVNFQQSR